MTTINETAHSGSQMKASLVEGLNTLDNNEVITFNKYKRLVLPLDGFVFWVKTTIFPFNSVYNASPLASFALSSSNKPEVQEPSCDCKQDQIKVPGSLHFSSERKQSSEGNITINKVIFTTSVDVNQLNREDPTCMWIGEFQGLRFAFSRHALLYKAAGLYHYQGDAVYSNLATQIVDNLNNLNTRELIISNSLPFWLAINPQYPIFPYPSGQAIPLYPADLSPNNLYPPYGTIYIYPQNTRAVQALPTLDSNSNPLQLCSDKVKIILYGCSNNLAWSLVNYINWLFVNFPGVGLQNMPVIKDEYEGQDEFTILAQKKSIEYTVSYNQKAIENIAQVYIKTIIPTFRTLSCP